MRSSVVSILGAVAAALAGGALWVWLGWPLPWLIGPLVATGLLNSVGAGLRTAPVARNAGQWIIGTALGTYFTAETLVRIAALAAPLALSVVYSLILCAGFTWALYRHAGASLPTAFFGGAVGGASEMAVQGERNGGRVETIAVAHSVRVMLVVLVLPFAYRWLNIQGYDGYAPGRADLDWLGLPLLGSLTLTAALLANQLHIPNAFSIGALAVSMVLTASGLLPSGVPSVLTDLGQMLIGMALGCRIERGFFTRAPRLVTVVVLCTLGAMVLSAVFGWLVARASGLSVATLILATAPGGMAEMSVTAKILKLGVPVVTVFHVVRLMVVILAAGPAYRWVARRVSSRAPVG